MKWIRTLGIYYYEYLGNDPEFDIAWLDDPPNLQDIKSIYIEVNKPTKSVLANDLQFKITIFLKTGTIQVQA